MPKQPVEPQPKNRVHQERIWAETINKETRDAQGYVFKDYFLNPYKLNKMVGCTDKPNTVFGIDRLKPKPDSDGSVYQKDLKELDDRLDVNGQSIGGSYFNKVLDEKSKRPRDKFDFPLTANMELGWFDDEKYTAVKRDDDVLMHFRNNSEITRYMDSFWRVQEQSKMNQPKK